MKASTQNCMNEMIAHARAGYEVIPMFFQNHGRATVSAAVRAAKTRGLLVEAGKDGCGNPLYSMPIPAATHPGSATLN